MDVGDHHPIIAPRGACTNRYRTTTTAKPHPCLQHIHIHLADCGAHGTWSNNRCVCTNTTPALGQTGYVGAACEIGMRHDGIQHGTHMFRASNRASNINTPNTAVYGVDLNGSDMMRSCSAAECGRVKPKDWVCFYAT